MDVLLDHIANKSPGGIPYPEAVQLMLLLYVTLDILPRELRGLALTREQLALLFSKLTAKGLILLDDAGVSSDVGVALSDPTRPEHWEQLAKCFIRGDITLDDSFYERAHQYV
jgi:hypothetical protein